MSISSRTPEGEPNLCPVCGHGFRLEPSRPFGDAPCPACGTLLWYLDNNGITRCFDPEASGLLELVASQLNLSPSTLQSRRLNEFDWDSLELVELVMELEERYE